MDRQTVEKKAWQVIAETLDLTDAECIPEADIQADELGRVQLAMQLEFQFGIEIDEDAFVNLRKYQDVLNLIDSKMGV